MIDYPEDLAKGEVQTAYRRGLDAARAAQCKLCRQMGSPIWSGSAGAYFHQDGDNFVGCKSEFIVALLDGRRLT